MAAKKARALKVELPWDTAAPVRLRMLWARQALKSHRLSAKFDGGERDYDAFSIHDVASACQEELAKVGVDFQFSVEKWSANGIGRMVEGWGIFTCVEKAGEEYDVGDECRVFAVGEGLDSSDKGFGKAVSYARKSALIQGLNLALGEDVEKTRQAPPPSSPEAPPVQASGGAPEAPAGVVVLSFHGQEYKLIPTQVIGSVTKFLSGCSSGDAVAAWLDDNKTHLANLWRYSDRMGYAVKKMAEARIQELSEALAQPSA